MMTKNFFLIFNLLFLSSTYLFSQPLISNVHSFPETRIGEFEKIELRFKLNEYENNYDDEIIKVDAEFISPANKIYHVSGFYFVDYKKFEDFDCGLDVPCEKLKVTEQKYNWIVRFTPNETGTWYYQITAKDKEGQTIYPLNQRKSFICISSNHTGFITKNNSRYLKKGDDPVFFTGVNIAWYKRSSYNKIPVKEAGTNDYKRYIRLLSKNNGNFMRLWINHPAGIAIVGKEWTTGQMHSFNNYNQKDAWQLDQIIAEADKNNVFVVLSLLHQNTFVNSYGVNNWDKNNAFNKKTNGNRNEGINSPFKIFYDEHAIKKTKNLIRYIIARWGYATNIISWELWNEVEQIEKIWLKSGFSVPEDYYKNVFRWHNDMAKYIRSTDPYGHLISTSSPNKFSDMGELFPNVWYNMDLTISHDYQYINNLNDFKRFESHLLNRANGFMNEIGLQGKPYMSQEWGITPGNQFSRNDPKGYEYHNCLWSSCMAGSFGAIAIWEWDQYVLKQHLFSHLKPVSVFMNSIVAQLDGTTRGYKTQMNGLSVFYATTSPENIFIGWCQDDNYDFSRVKDSKYVKNLKSAKPKPSGKKNWIKLPVNKNKQSYTVKWYDTQSAKMVKEEIVRSKGHKIKFVMPQSLRTSTFGDGAFIIQAGTTRSQQADTTTEEKPTSGKTSKRIKL